MLLLFLFYQMKTSSSSETTAPRNCIKAMNFVKWDAASWGRMKDRYPFTNVVALWNEIFQDSTDAPFIIS